MHKLLDAMFEPDPGVTYPEQIVDTMNDEFEVFSWGPPSINSPAPAPSEPITLNWQPPATPIEDAPFPQGAFMVPDAPLVSTNYHLDAF